VPIALKRSADEVVFFIVCKSCIYKYFEEIEDCPRCGRDLRPDPYITIRFVD
jgi:rRNA maturation endonuclease Nob1